MIKKLIPLNILIVFIITGCGSDSNDNINSNKAKNSLGYYDDLTLLYDETITTSWIQRDKKYGFESLYYFENKKELDMNNSFVDAFYNNENYGVDITSDKLYTYKFFKYSETIENGEINITNVYYDYNKSIVECFDFNSVNSENNCFDISKYEILNGNMKYQKDYDFCPNTSFTQYVFATHSLVGEWIQYEYEDDNETAKTNNGLGIEYLYKFESNNKISLMITLINTWIPLGKYSTDKNQTVLTFEMGNNSSLQQLEFVEHKDPIEIQYQDENGKTQTRYMPCVKTAKYNLNEDNNTKIFDKYYQLCKKY